MIALLASVNSQDHCLALLALSPRFSNQEIADHTSLNQRRSDIRVSGPAPASATTLDGLGRTRTDLDARRRKAALETRPRQRRPTLETRPRQRRSQQRPAAPYLVGAGESRAGSRPDRQIRPTRHKRAFSVPAAPHKGDCQRGGHATPPGLDHGPVGGRRHCRSVGGRRNRRGVDAVALPRCCRKEGEREHSSIRLPVNRRLPEARAGPQM